MKEVSDYTSVSFSCWHTDAVVQTKGFRYNHLKHTRKRPYTLPSLRPVTLRTPEVRGVVVSQVDRSSEAPERGKGSVGNIPLQSEASG